MPAESRKKTLRVIPVAKRTELPTPPGIVAPTEEEAPAPLLSIATLKSMASSLALHTFLLIGLACWYFAPTTRPPRAFDLRLAGSERGV